MAYWLLKTEPDTFSIDDLAKNSTTEIWDGIRNYQARNIIRDQISKGDIALIYHSSCKDVGIVGLAKITSAGYPCPHQFDPESDYFDPKSTVDAPRWFVMDVAFLSKFDTLIPLKALKSAKPLNEMALIRQGRLSVQPVTEIEYDFIMSNLT